MRQAAEIGERFDLELDKAYYFIANHYPLLSNDKRLNMAPRYTKSSPLSPEELNALIQNPGFNLFKIHMKLLDASTTFLNNQQLNIPGKDLNNNAEISKENDSISQQNSLSTDSLKPHQLLQEQLTSSNSSREQLEKSATFKIPRPKAQYKATLPQAKKSPQNPKTSSRAEQLKRASHEYRIRKKKETKKLEDQIDSLESEITHLKNEQADIKQQISFLYDYNLYLKTTAKNFYTSSQLLFSASQQLNPEAKTEAIEDITLSK